MGSNSAREGTELTPFFTEHDVYLFKEGTHYQLYDKFGSHCVEREGVSGAQFAVWAPNAGQVFVIGDCNGWRTGTHPLQARWDSSGIWEGFVPGAKKGDRYKYHIVSRERGYTVDKGDPYGLYWELSPQTASRIWDLEYTWNDDQWMSRRRAVNNLRAPLSIYELHLGSWCRVPEERDRPLSYREMAVALVEYVKRMNFTHVEFLPVMEHPFYGSWGYQSVGYFAPTSRYGSPQDLMYLIDCLHQNDIGVILDWVPSHFPTDEHGLMFFDGTHLYEHADPRKGFHPDWKSSIFNYGRHEVRNFLIGNALFWLDKYHVDGLRVDAVASMLYLDYSRNAGEWVPNEYGGRENLEAIGFLRKLNETVYARHPDVQMFAEESTAWPMVSRPLYTGGLGFGFKWNMGWMHDTLAYCATDPLFRKYHQGQLTFSIWYAFSENFVLPLSHDEVVHGKGSLLGRMPGDDWQKYANLRALLAYLYTHPGKKLLFMGGEFGQWGEWNHDRSLDWHLLQYGPHQGIQRLVRDLNGLYRDEPALYVQDSDAQGFEWIDFHDADRSVISFIRYDPRREVAFVVVGNFTPMRWTNYRVGVPWEGHWQEVLNSDADVYGGSNTGNGGAVEAMPVSFYGRYEFSLSLTIPPLGVLIFKGERKTT